MINYNNLLRRGETDSGIRYSIYESVETDDVEISKGDVIAWEDSSEASPDTIHVAFVKRVWMVSREENKPRIATTHPNRLVEYGDNIRAVWGHDKKFDRYGHSLRFAEQFIDSGYDDWMNVQTKMNGKISVEGE